MDWDYFELFVSTNRIYLPIRQKQFTVNTNLLRRMVRSIMPQKPSLDQMMLSTPLAFNTLPYELRVSTPQPYPVKEEKLNYVPLRPIPNLVEQQSPLMRKYEKVARVLDEFDGQISEFYAEKVKPLAKKLCPYTYIRQLKRKAHDMG